MEEKGKKGSCPREGVRELCREGAAPPGLFVALSELVDAEEMMDAQEMMDGVMETFTPWQFLFSQEKHPQPDLNQSFTIIICFQERMSNLLSVFPNSFQKSFQVDNLLDPEKQMIHLL